MIKHFASKFLIERLHKIEASRCQVPDHSYDFVEVENLISVLGLT